jgi:hypothetical protein
MERTTAMGDIIGKNYYSISKNQITINDLNGNKILSDTIALIKFLKRDILNLNYFTMMKIIILPLSKIEMSIFTDRKTENLFFMTKYREKTLC